MPSEGLSVQTAFLTVPKPNALDSRLRGNDGILSCGKLSEKQQPLCRHSHESGIGDSSVSRNSDITETERPRFPPARE
ncbi:hypothetical protein [Neisseria lactamica]|uniref:hypothetical protein n=1 Tax=Neisseria lactamica TaxID=486 RepID=UPI000A8339F2|nr:hypothetical protein [Neisseria lactamica]